ncbi:hypothetical protein D3C83_39230 [compost metagenome]
MGPVTRTKLLAVRRSPSVWPERPSTVRLNMRMTVSGMPMPMPSPKKKAIAPSTSALLENGTSAKPIAPMKKTHASSVSPDRRLIIRARNSRTTNAATARLASTPPMAVAESPIEWP